MSRHCGDIKMKESSSKEESDTVVAEVADASISMSTRRHERCRLLVIVRLVVVPLFGCWRRSSRIACKWMCLVLAGSGHATGGALEDEAFPRG